MRTTPETVFHYEVQKSGDEISGAITTIICHGGLVGEDSGQVSQTVKPLITMGRRIMIDLTDVSYHDATGRATQVGLKISSVKEDFCKLEFFNPSPLPREKKQRSLASGTWMHRREPPAALEADPLPHQPKQPRRDRD